MNKRLLEVIVALFWFAQFCYVPYLPPHLALLGASATLTGAVVGVYGFVQLVCRIPVGVALGRFNLYKLSVLVACACTTLAALGIALTQNPMVVFLCRAVAGLGSSMWAGFAVLYNTCYDKTEATRSMGNLNMFNSIGRLAAFILGGLLANIWGYHLLFWLCVAVGGAGFVFSLFIRPGPAPAAAPAGEKDKAGAAFSTFKVITNRPLLALGFVTAVYYMASTATSTAFVSNIATDLGATNFQLSSLSAIGTAVSLVAFRFLTPLVARFGEDKLITASFIGFAVYCAATVHAPNVPVLMALQVLSGFSGGIMQALPLAICFRGFPPAAQSTAISVFQALYGAGMTVGPILMGLLVDAFGYLFSFWGFALLSLIGAVLAKVMLHLRGPEKQAAPQ